MRPLFAAALLLIAAMTIAVAPRSAIATRTDYIVRPGDYLVLIGQKFGVPWQSIAVANGIVAPYLIFPGQSLVIPPPSQCEDSDSKGIQYAVQAGDYLVLIGQRFGVPWQEIAEANCISAPYLIFPGQVLTVPQEQDEDQD